MPSADRLVWDATTVLEALGAADVALWVWEPERDRLRLSGASRALGLGPLAPEAASAEAFTIPCKALAPPESVADLKIDHFDGLVTFDDLPADGRCVRDLWF